MPSSQAVSRTASSWLRSRARRRVPRPAVPGELTAGDQRPTHRGIVSAGVRARRETRDDRPRSFDDVLRMFNAGRHWRT